MCNDYIGTTLVSTDGVLYTDQMIKNCLRCKKDYKTYYCPQKYCSYECWNLVKRKHWYKCEGCGSEFHGTAGHSNRFCGQKCYWKSLEIDKEQYRLNRNAYTRKYRKEHPEKTQASKQRRRARVAGATGHFTEEEWRAKKKEFRDRCALCRGKKKLTVDHIVSLFAGGSNYIENIQPLCRECNSRKWAHEFHRVKI